MKITADTNVLVRAATEDDPHQSKAAQAALAGAHLVALPTVAVCELVWVLMRRYGIPSADVAEVIRRLVGAENVAVDRQAIDAGLAQLEAGGDFADGVIAIEGRRLGADTFASFDRTAVRLLQAQNRCARLLA